MERHRFRSTSIVDIQAELHESDLLREARERNAPRRPKPRSRGLLGGLSLLGRRIIG